MSAADALPWLSFAPCKPARAPCIHHLLLLALNVVQHLIDASYHGLLHNIDTVTSCNVCCTSLALPQHPLMLPFAWLESAVHREHHAPVRVVSSVRDTVARRSQEQPPRQRCWIDEQAVEAYMLTCSFAGYLGGLEGAWLAACAAASISTSLAICVSKGKPFACHA